MKSNAHIFCLRFGLTTIRLHLAIYFQSPFTGKAIKRLNHSAFRSGIVSENHIGGRVDSRGRTIWIADAHRDDGKRFIVHTDGKLTALMELEIGNSRLRLVYLRGRRFNAAA